MRCLLPPRESKPTCHRSPLTHHHSLDATSSAQVTASIDEIIKQRIKDGLFDDVIRKAALRPNSYKPRAAEISTEKSKLGLGEVYAKEYEQQILGNATEESKEEEKAHAAVRELFATLSSRLDNLFSFHATPKPHQSEVTVKSKVAAVSMEEATPTAMASSESLAPEEVYGKRKGAKLAAREELSQEERKAQRRKKKRVRKRRGAERDEMEALKAKLTPGGNASKRIDAKNAERALADAKRKGTVTTGVENGRGGNGQAGSQFTRSSKFFGAMQEGAYGGKGAGSKRGAPGSGGDEEPSAKRAARFKL